MNRYIGGDPEAMRDHAAFLTRRSDLLQDLEGRLRTLIEMVTWTGEDAETFRTDWSFRVRPAMQDAAFDLHRFGLRLDRQAEEQEEASSPGGDVLSAAIASSFIGRLDGPIRPVATAPMPAPTPVSDIHHIGPPDLGDRIGFDLDCTPILPPVERISAELGGAVFPGE